MYDQLTYFLLNADEVVYAAGPLFRETVLAPVLYHVKEK